MPKRKKASDSFVGMKDSIVVTEGMDMGVYQAYARNQAASILQNPKKQRSTGFRGHYDDLDLDHLFRTTRALIATNDEIWNKCRESKAPGALAFKRVVFSEVNVETVGAHVQFTTNLTVDFQVFNVPRSIPESLTDLISSKPVLREGDIPDYKLYLERALVMHGEVLKPFLVTLRDHLEYIQVYIGTIDSWLMESGLSIRFLEETLSTKEDGITIELPHPDDFRLAYGNCVPYCTGSCNMVHPSTSRCGWCHASFTEHDGHLCPRSITPTRGAFVMTLDLKRVAARRGKYTLSCDITNQNDKWRLKRFVEFISA